MKLIFQILLITLSLSCTKKVKMWNMLPEEIDVSKYLKNGEYKLDSCKGRVDRLIKVNPKIPNNFDSVIYDKAKLFLNSIKKVKTEEIIELSKNTKYVYTYFILYEPIDVYETTIFFNKKEKKIYIRANEKGEIIDNFTETKWVTNECE